MKKGGCWAITFFLSPLLKGYEQEKSKLTYFAK